MVEGHKRKSHEHRKDLAGEYRWSDTGQFILFLVFIIGMTADVFVLKLFSMWQAAVPWYLPPLICLPFVISGVYFGYKAHKKIFEEERTKLMVITTGVFARTRHPLYFGIILIYLGFVILSLSVVALVIFFVLLVFYYYISRYEEQILQTKLGDEYISYMKEVPMFLPKIRK